MHREDALKLQTALLEVFRGFNVNVSVGITKEGVAISSQDVRVDAKNIGKVRVLEEESMGTEGRWYNNG